MLLLDTPLRDKNKNILRGILRADNTSEPEIQIYDKMANN